LFCRSYTSIIEAVWDKEFELVERPVDTSLDQLGLDRQMSAPPDSRQARPKAQDADELARTAGLLIESVRDEQNPKFQNSQFMGLMKQLRDREVVVEGDKMVESSSGVSDAQWANDFQTDLKGKRKAVDIPTQETNITSSAEQLDARRAFRSFTRSFSPARKEVQSLAATHPVEETVVHQEEDLNDAFFRQENAEYTEYWNAHHTEPAKHATAALSHTADWDRMQQQWEVFEANATGIQAVDNYQFQENNPYVLGDRSRNRQHMIHFGGSQSFYEVWFHFFIFLPHAHLFGSRVSWSLRRLSNETHQMHRPGTN
jgi:peroxin-5